MSREFIQAFKKKPVPLLLRGKVQHYAWGGTGPGALIPRLLRMPPQNGQPYAELWMGDHPANPADVLLENGVFSLRDLVDNAADELLGPVLAGAYKQKLPFLAKVLDVSKPLSIQAHPDRVHASDGFERENRLSLPLDSPHRHYKDRLHKPEMVVALSDFYALAQFRPLALIADTLDAHPELRALQPDFRRRMGHSGSNMANQKALLKIFFQRIMTLDTPGVAHIIEPLVGRLKDENAAAPFSKDDVRHWVLRAYDIFCAPDRPDRGLLVMFLLNLVHLKPGEGLFLKPGELHSYLEGAAHEVMANSDNVVRGGLTSKHVNVYELLGVTSFAPAAPQVRRPAPGGAFESLAEEFELTLLEVTSQKPYTSPKEHSADLLFVWEGEAALITTAGTVSLAEGQSVLIPAVLGQYAVTPPQKVRLFRVSVPMDARPRAATRWREGG